MSELDIYGHGTHGNSRNTSWLLVGASRIRTYDFDRVKMALYR